MGPSARDRGKTGGCVRAEQGRDSGSIQEIPLHSQCAASLKGCTRFPPLSPGCPSRHRKKGKADPYLLIIPCHPSEMFLLLSPWECILLLRHGNVPCAAASGTARKESIWSSLFGTQGKGPSLQDRALLCVCCQGRAFPSLVRNPGTLNSKGCHGESVRGALGKASSGSACPHGKAPPVALQDSKVCAVMFPG